MKRISIFILVCCAGCKTGEISCPVLVPLKLKHTTHYRISPVKTLQPVARTEERKSVTLHERHAKAIESLEEWDCPKPGMNKPSKFVQQNIKANKKKVNAYYKNKFRSDSVRLSVSRAQ